MVLKKQMSIKRMNKKGVFFTLLVISILLLFLVSYTFSSVIKDRGAITKRIETMNNFVFSVEQDLPRQLYISGFRIIFLIEKEIVDTGNYIADFNSTFAEVFYNGTLNGNLQPLMIGANFSGIQESLNKKAIKINANITLTNPSLIVGQDNPWNIKVSLTADLLIIDNTNLVLWNRTAEIVSYVPIENFEDPFYVVGTSNLVPNKINKTIHEPFVDGNDVSNLSSHLEESYYINSTSAPSFIDRLEGRTSPNVNGIESLVYLPELSFQGIPLKDKSVVDYIYFSSQNPTPLYKVTGMPSWFKLDDSSLDVYGVRGISYLA